MGALFKTASSQSTYWRRAAGIFSKVFGIVEFPDGVQRVDPTDICFCDDGNEILTELNKKQKHS